MLGFLLLISIFLNCALAWFLYQAKKSALPAEQKAEAEAAILRQAMHRGGRVTAVEVAARTRLPVAVIETVLHQMSVENQCLSTLDAEGLAFYLFPPFDDSAQRQEAIEREILLLAQTNGGEISVQQIARQTALSIEESRQWMTLLAERGACIPVDAQRQRFKFQ